MDLFGLAKNGRKASRSRWPMCHDHWNTKQDFFNARTGRNVELLLFKWWVGVSRWQNVQHIKPQKPSSTDDTFVLYIIISNSIKRGYLVNFKLVIFNFTKWPESSGTFNSQSPLFMLLLCNIMFAWISFVLKGRWRQTRSV